MAAVFRHSASKGTARLMLLAMADEANADGELTAYKRSQSHLARKANCSPASAKRSITALVDLGEVLVLERGDGRTSSSYRIVLPGIDQGAQDDTPAGSPRPPRGVTTTAQGAQNEPPIIPLFPVDDPCSPATSSVDIAAPLDFDDWWARYPRKDGKGQARAKWKAALAKVDGDAARLVAAAERYRDDPNRDPTYTKLPATWLNGECWDDAPLPPRTGAAKPSPREARIMSRPDGPARLAEALGITTKPDQPALPEGTS
jgi:hypothetical protein